MAASIGAHRSATGAIGKGVVADASCTEVPYIGWPCALHIGCLQGVVLGMDDAL